MKVKIPDIFEIEGKRILEISVRAGFTEEFVCLDYCFAYFDGKDALLSTLSSLFDEKYEELIQELSPDMNAMDQLLFLNHLLDHNRIYYKLLRKIIAKGQADGQLSIRSNVNEMVKLYALCERALLYDWCLCSGEYSLVEYAAKVMPGFLSSFQP